MTPIERAAQAITAEQELERLGAELAVAFENIGKAIWAATSSDAFRRAVEALHRPIHVVPIKFPGNLEMEQPR